MLYLDANVFILPALYKGAKADAAAEVLRRVRDGETEAITASLTIDEVVHIVQKNTTREAGIQVGRAALSMPHLTVANVGADDIRSALTLMEGKGHPKPRDAIHAAVALKHNATTVVSDDDIFEKIQGLKRVALA